MVTVLQTLWTIIQLHEVIFCSFMLGSWCSLHLIHSWITFVYCSEMGLYAGNIEGKMWKLYFWGLCFRFGHGFLYARCISMKWDLSGVRLQMALGVIQYLFNVLLSSVIFQPYSVYCLLCSIQQPIISAVWNDEFCAFEIWFANIIDFLLSNFRKSHQKRCWI